MLSALLLATFGLTPVSLPADFRLDGVVGEWASPPSVRLGAAAQVAGKAKVKDDQDLSATVWLAFTETRLVIAGQVKDDVVRFAGPEEQWVNADHVELWLSFPGVALPPIGFANQFDEVVVRDEAGCQDLEAPDQCARWFREQQALRVRLGSLFTRQYVLQPSGVTEAFAGTPLPEAQPGCCKDSQVVMTKVADGYTFEAQIAVGDWPPLKGPALSTFRVMVDLVDSDSNLPNPSLESFVSSSPKRKYGKTETFNEVRLAQPLGWKSEPAGLLGAPNLVVYPGVPVRTAGWLRNEPQGYQYSPERPSPEFIRLDLKTSKLRELGELAIWKAVSLEGEPTLSVYRRGQLVTSVRVMTDVLAMKQRGSVLYVALDQTHPMSKLGSGQCGACTIAAFQIVSIGPDGKVTSLASRDLNTQESENDWVYDVHASSDAEANRVGLSGTATHLLPNGATEAFEWAHCWEWNAKTNAYDDPGPKVGKRLR